MDAKSPRDGRVIEELGTYDPMVRDLNARALLNGERIDYWLGVGAQPTDNVRVLIKKYGSEGTHLEEQKAAIEKLGQGKTAPPPVAIKREEPPKEEPAEEASSEEASAETATEESTEAPAEEGATAEAEAPAEDAKAEEEAPAAEAKTEEKEGE